MDPRSLALIVTITGLAGGCASSYQTYSGQRRSPLEVAELSLDSPTDLTLDGTAIPQARTRCLEILPGWHEMAWTFRYPNSFERRHELVFRVGPGDRCRFGQRFVPMPNQGGPLAELVELTFDAATLPFRSLFPPEPASEAPEGDYYAWVIHLGSRRLVAGEAPNLAPAHPVISFVPVDR